MTLSPTTKFTISTKESRPAPRRRRFAVAFGIAALAVAPTPTAAAPQPAPTKVATPSAARISVSANGGTAVYSAVDASGDVTVMLASTKPGKENGKPRSLVKLGDGIRGGDTVMPVISADGCVVVAVTQVAFDLFRDDDRNNRWDVYRLVLPDCGGRDNAWELVSADKSGIAVDSVSNVIRPAVSASGSTIAYTSVDPDGYSSVHLVDLTKPITTPRTRTVPSPAEKPTQAFRYRGADQPALSGDASRLVFRADFDPTGATPTWNAGRSPGGNASTEIYVWELEGDDGGIDLISQRGGEPGRGQTRQPTISADGSAIAFVASDPKLDPTAGWVCDPNCPEQVLVARNADGWQPPIVASASPLPRPVDPESGPAMTVGNRSSWRPVLSDDGRQVAFLTRAKNLTPSGALHSSRPLAGDLLIADVPSRTDASDPAGPAPMPLDVSTPRRADHTGFAMSASFATVVFDVGKVDDGHILGEADGRTIVARTAPTKLSMADLNFGTVVAEKESNELYTVLRNAGPVGFLPTAVEINSDRFDVTGGTCTNAVVVAPGRSCTVYATFTPARGKASVGVLTVTGAEGQKVTATVTGRDGIPGLKIEPDGADFGRVAVGDTGESKPLYLTNYGFDPMTLSRIALSGANAKMFVITSDECSAVVLEPEESCQVDVTFKPGATGDRWATLQVESNDGPATAVTLVGTSFRSAKIETKIAKGDDTLTVDGSGFAPNRAVVVSVVGEHVTFAVKARKDGTIHLTDVPTGPGPDVTVVAVAADGTVAFTRITVAVERSAPTFLPGYGTGGGGPTAPMAPVHQ